MKSAALSHKDKETGEVVLIASREEVRILTDIMEAHCKANKRQKKAAALLKDLEDAPAWI